MSVKFIHINLVKNVIIGVNLVEIGIFGENGQNRVILAYLGPKGGHMSKFGEGVQIFFPLKVSKNYFNQVYG